MEDRGKSTGDRGKRCRGERKLSEKRTLREPGYYRQKQKERLGQLLFGTLPISEKLSEARDRLCRRRFFDSIFLSKTPHEIYQTDGFSRLSKLKISPKFIKLFRDFERASWEISVESRLRQGKLC